VKRPAKQRRNAQGRDKLGSRVGSGEDSGAHRTRFRRRILTHALRCEERARDVARVTVDPIGALATPIV